MPMTRTRAEQARYQAKYRKRRHLNGGKPLTVSTDLVKAKLERLRKRGMGMRMISQKTGVDRRSLQRILNGDYRSVTLLTHEKIMGLELDPFTVDARPTQRRLQALAAIGYTWHRLDAIRGKTGTYFLLKRKRVYGQVADEIAELYERLSAHPATVQGDTLESRRSSKRGITMAKRAAARNGWAPPLAWDDIDNLLEKPKGVRNAA